MTKGISNAIRFEAHEFVTYNGEPLVGVNPPIRFHSRII